MPRNIRNHNRGNKHKRANGPKRAQRSKWLQMRNRARFLPAILITLAASFLLMQPQFAFLGNRHGVLAYATNVSQGGLLAATNDQRSAHGVATLALNGQLNNAAQAKANDMVARNYWSHQTPDGKQPWVFITGAGYQYLSAGENLAYGFSTSSTTVTGWMNSPSHKDNLLSTNFTEVGFGIANSPDYVNNGPQTIVVAMYGRPQGQPAAAQPAEPKPAAPTQPATTKPKSTTPAAQPSEPVETPEPTAPAEEPAPVEDKDEEPIATVANISEAPPTAGTSKVQRVHILTGGSAIWSATFVVLGVCAVGLLWLLHRGFRFGRWLKASEKMIGKYIHLDLTVLSIIYLGFVLLSTSGTIR